METVKAPFTPEQVEHLRARQAANWLHGYTCGNDSRHGNLTPTSDGWICEVCDYTQDWAHVGDASDDPPPNPLCIPSTPEHHTSDD